MPSRYGLAIFPNKFLLFLIGYKIASVNKSHIRAGVIDLSPRSRNNGRERRGKGRIRARNDRFRPGSFKNLQCFLLLFRSQTPKNP